MIQSKNKRLLAVYLVGDGTANFVKTDYQVVVRRALATATHWKNRNGRLYHYIFNPLSRDSDEQQISPWNYANVLHIGDENKGHDQTR